MKLFIKKYFEVLLLFIIGVFIINIFIYFNYLNKVILDQLKYFIFLLIFGYIYHKFIDGVSKNTSLLRKPEFYLNFLSINVLYFDFKKGLLKILSLKLKKEYKLLLISLYFIFVIAIALINGGLKKYSVFLLLISFFLFLLYILYLSYKDKKSAFLLTCIKYTLIAASLLIFALYYYFGYIVFLDMVLVCSGLLIPLFGLLFNRNYLYQLCLLLLGSLPLCLIFDFVKTADFLANCLYILLVFGVLKDMFYDKFFYKSYLNHE